MVFKVKVEKRSVSKKRPVYTSEEEEAKLTSDEEFSEIVLSDEQEDYQEDELEADSEAEYDEYEAEEQE